jgi:hypothetical protein
MMQQIKMHLNGKRTFLRANFIGKRTFLGGEFIGKRTLIIVMG